MSGDGWVELFQGRDLQWRWRRKAGNGEVIADSGEGYMHRTDCAAMVAELFPSVPLVTGDAKSPVPDLDDDAD